MLKLLPTVLIVDPEDNTAILVQIVMDKLGIPGTIKHAYTGIEALDYLHLCEDSDTFPSTLIVDLDLPDINGTRFIEAVLAIKGSDLNRIKLVVMSQRHSQDDFEFLAGLGIDQVLQKSSVPEFFSTYYSQK